MTGIIVVNKPSGITSFDVIRNLRKILKEKKMGHTGTLDPMATGVLIICIGKATRLAQSIENQYKKYVAEFQLGYQTDTYDKMGKIINISDIKSAPKEELEKVLKKFSGKIKQIPPMYSALKKDGKKFYELARQGIEIEREAREINIKSIEVVDIRENTIKIKCDVSKGTYIRTLVNDIGLSLGSYGTLTSLERISVGDITIDNSYTLDEIEAFSSGNNYEFLKSVEEIFQYERYDILNDKDFLLFKNGNTLVTTNKENNLYKIYFKNEFVGLGSIENNRLKGYKYF